MNKLCLRTENHLGCQFLCFFYQYSDSPIFPRWAISFDSWRNAGFFIRNCLHNFNHQVFNGQTSSCGETLVVKGIDFGTFGQILIVRKIQRTAARFDVLPTFQVIVLRTYWLDFWTEGLNLKPLFLVNHSIQTLMTLFLVSESCYYENAKLFSMLVYLYIQTYFFVTTDLSCSTEIQFEMALSEKFSVTKDQCPVPASESFFFENFSCLYNLDPSQISKPFFSKNAGLSFFYKVST